MPAKKSKSDKHTTIDFKDIIWLVNNLTHEQLQEVNDKPASLEDINNWMTEEIENGAKFSFKFDDYSNCPQANVIYGTNGYISSGYALSSRGRDFEHCMSILMYKFLVVCEGKLSEAGQYSVDKPKYG